MARAIKTSPPAVVLTARVPQDVKAALDKAARKDARTTSGLVAKIVAEWLTERKYLK
jgi:predicted transcriptional regulator